MPEQIVKQRSRGFICVNAHPVGCARNVEQQISHVRSSMPSGPANGLRNVLVLGASTGYGLATRIATGWGLGCRTLGVFFEKPPAGRRTASAGYYNCVALHQAAERDGLWVRSVNGDAFSDEIKQEVAQVIEQSMGKVDLVVYSLASPKRTNPRTGLTHTSSLKAIGSPFTGKTIDLGNGTVGTASIEAAAQAEIDETVAVMGGEDWRWWIEGLADNGLLARGAQTLAYSYYGPAVTWPIYKDGTIGAAKRDLKATADWLNAKLEQEVGGSATVAVNKAVVTQASAAIPVVPLYVSLLFRVMKAKGIHEGCIEQMTRLVRDHLAADGGPRCDADGLIRLDDLEMRVDVQDEIAGLWPRVGTDNLAELADFAGFRGDFNNLFGFDVDGVDYDSPVETEVFLP
ncbi:MAG: trans-2-enoyl-CoA reductase family protein [Acidobacteriia bacterium]|nr:trans-2-enoyl-CoA reductase family protein [Terriglobia bacterium]MYG02974.1 trans-2-enoyl-CoA reductase family protein [Terriglobia bacterium]MYK09611.1 trans-2-enoyl-CoA reductase family protein [Terriglobia bacterium]